MESKLARKLSNAIAVCTGSAAGVTGVETGLIFAAALAAAVAAEAGAVGAGLAAELRLLPINKESAGTRPLPRSPNSSSNRPRYFSLTQSSTKRLGA
jgi:hypothetical protein